MSDRFWARLWVGSKVIPRLLCKPWRKLPRRVQTILIAHHLLLGDTIMLAPLLKKLRRQYPNALIDMLCPSAYMPLFEKNPYGVRALSYEPRKLASHKYLLQRGPYDLALVAGDNRCSWLAHAMGARWIRAFRSDRYTYKEWPIDEWTDWPTTPRAWGEIAATLIDGDAPEPFSPGEWPDPMRSALPPLPTRYCVIHVGASSMHKHWPSTAWNTLLRQIRSAGLTIVLSAAKSEMELVRQLEVNAEDINLSGKLDLAGMWHVLKEAEFLVCPDTGIAHLARLTNTPTVALFGPGSPVVSGAGEFWRHSPFRTVSVDIACRDQHMLFERHLPWVKHCWRSVAKCGNPVCMQRIQPEMVAQALKDVFSPPETPSAHQDRRPIVVQDLP